MGYIDWERLWQKYPQGYKIPPVVLGQIKNALDRLHRDGFVFGH